LDKRTPVKSIRAYCIECGDGTYKEVRLCPIPDCPLYPYRFGRRPTEQDIKEIEQAIKGRK
jgi:hypothetical protein